MATVIEAAETMKDRLHLRRGPLRSVNWQLQSSHRDEKHSTENIVNDIVICLYGSRWDHFAVHLKLI